MLPAGSGGQGSTPLSLQLPNAATSITRIQMCHWLNVRTFIEGQSVCAVVRFDSTVSLIHQRVQASIEKRNTGNAVFLK
jgi:hypothetical protein